MSLHNRKYIIVDDYTIENLVRRVDEHMEDGHYIPTGGPFRDTGKGIWCQAMFSGPQATYNLKQTLRGD